MKERVTEQKRLKEIAEMELVIDGFNCPDDVRIKEMIHEIVEMFDLRNTKLRTKVVPTGGDKRIRFVVIATTTLGEPVMAIAEVFSQLIGNIRIYERVTKYLRFS